MTQELDLSVPPHQNSNRTNAPVWLGILCVAILLTVCADLVFNVLTSEQKTATVLPETSGRFDPEKLKAVALRLEKNDLLSEAEKTWRRYLNDPAVSAEKKAKIWYRIGKLRQETEAYRSAVTAFFLSESAAGLPELSDELNRRVDTCLKALGAFTAAREERKARVDYHPDAEAAEGENASPVVAEIGSEKITSVELDHRIEDHVEMQLMQYGAALPENIRFEQEKRMLERFSSPEARKKFLQNTVAREILYREALKQGMATKSGIKRILRKQKQTLLAGKTLEKHVHDRITVTKGDLQNWYAAHKHEFVKPAGALISHIRVDSKQKIKTLKEKLKAGSPFADLDEQFSEDDQTARDEGRIPEWISFDASGSIPHIGNGPELREKLQTAEPGTVLPDAINTQKGLHLIQVRKKRQKHTHPFEDVKQQVRRRFYREKARELENAYMESLKEKYNVVIHPSALDKE